jgi:tripartite-type tricarboxylate transporter receptor subunit TctC
MSEHRLKVAPDIPTTVEAGLPGLIAANFNGLFGPAGLPATIVDGFAKETRVAMQDAALQKVMTDSGFEPLLDSGPQAAQHMIDSELARWAPIIKKIGFKAQ